MSLTRRAMCKTTVATLVAGAWRLRFRAADAVEDLKVPDNVPTEKFDFEAKGIEGWTTVDGQWAMGDHIQAWLNGKLYLDHRDPRCKSGRVGLWTKADSITAFDDLTIRGVTGGGGCG